MKGHVMFALYTPQNSLLGLFESKWKAGQGEQLWNYPYFTIKRVWVEYTGETVFEISEHKYKRIRA